MLALVLLAGAATADAPIVFENNKRVVRLRKKWAAKRTRIADEACAADPGPVCVDRVLGAVTKALLDPFAEDVHALNLGEGKLVVRLTAFLTADATLAQYDNEANACEAVEYGALMSEAETIAQALCAASAGGAGCPQVMAQVVRDVANRVDPDGSHNELDALDDADPARETPEAARLRAWLEGRCYLWRPDR